MFGWNRLGGDLRIAHFLGMHAEQAMWLLGVVVGGIGVAKARILVIVGAIARSMAAVVLMVHATRGGSIWPV